MKPFMITVRLAVGIVVLVLAVTASAISAEKSSNADHGTLTAVEPDGAVVISGKGYYLDSQVSILDPIGKATILESAELPTQVYFKYVYTPRGAIIQMLQIRPE